MFWSSYEGHKDCVRRLCEQGAPVNKADKVSDRDASSGCMSPCEWQLNDMQPNYLMAFVFCTAIVLRVHVVC